ncbi:beta-lactamase family protein [Weissella diestrammenae]|uniref:Beta-lactamase family protein n=1 Tax=Weissella diestrammenae TaxID=1162633 RepID=A0A7G9T6G3_9LACO|nr:serine hydrolase domain-containing protein [Weissella diestrammenae]MCM0583261.1 beta-lactamase family protein [Weissella diestrammenae]QNN75688.1 beta-lactamase family protein [Weissella diestrammenae]
MSSKKARRYRRFCILVGVIMVAIVSILGLGQLQRQKQAKKVVQNQKAQHVKQPHKQISSKYQSIKSVPGIPPTDALGQKIKTTLTSINYSGTALIVKNGRPIFHQAYGYADQDQKKLNTTDSLFQIASVMKNMTAILVMNEVRAGRLSLNQHIDVFYPQLPRASQITVLQLLNMSTGYRQTNSATTSMSADDYINYDVNHVLDDGYTSWKYRAINYSILVGIIQKTSGKSYQTLFNDYFIKKHHYQFKDYQAFLASDARTHGYDAKDNHVYADSALMFEREVGTGNLALTDSQFYRYLVDEMTGQLIQPDLFKQMLQPAAGSDFSGGLYWQRFANRYYLHGNIMGYEPTVYTSYDAKNMVILLSNHNSDSSNAPIPRLNQKTAETIYQMIQ